MLTENEETQLDFALEDLRKEFLELIRTDNTDLLDFVVGCTYRKLQELIKEITSRKLRY